MPTNSPAIIRTKIPITIRICIIIFPGSNCKVWPTSVKLRHTLERLIAVYPAVSGSVRSRAIYSRVPQWTICDPGVPGVMPGDHALGRALEGDIALR